MGFTLQNQDSLDQALDCFEESLNIRKVQLGLDAKEVGDVLNMMVCSLFIFIAFASETFQRWLVSQIAIQFRQ